MKKGEDGGAYNPFLAQRRTNSYSKSSARALKINDATWQAIQNHLRIRFLPYQIADFLQKSANDATIAPVIENSIHNYFHFHMKGELKKLALQEPRQKGKKRSTRGTEKRRKLANITLIDERPEEANARTVPFHWEGDLIIGKDHKSALSVIVERQTRYVLIDRLENYTAPEVKKRFEKRLKTLEPQLLKALPVTKAKRWRSINVWQVPSK